MNLIFNGFIKNGIFKLDDRTRFLKNCSGLKDGKYQIQFKKYKNVRSNKQNSYYWGVVIETLAEEFGHTPDEMHDALKLKFLLKHQVGKPDTLISTADLSTIDFDRFIEKVKVWAASEYGVIIPDPGQVDFLGE